MKKLKIEIKSRWTGKVLFEYESENNTIKKTLEKAYLGGAYLVGADLGGADLGGADLRSAYLGGAYLGGADLGGAYLRGADLGGADLGGADLRGAYLGGADLGGAYLGGADLGGAYLGGAYLGGADLGGAYLRGDIGEKIKIKTASVFTGLYKYIVIPFIASNGTRYVKMGCYTRKVVDWDKDFWNNESEFPNDKSEKSQLRVMAYETAKQWFKIKNTTP